MGCSSYGGSDLDVKSVDAKLLAAGRDVLSSQHGTEESSQYFVVVAENRFSYA